MKSLRNTVCAVTSLALLAGAPAFAQAGEDAVEVESEDAVASLSIDSPIGVLMADEAAKAVVIKHFGGQDVSQHPMYEQFKAMSLKEVAPFSQGMITDEMLEKIAADLAALT